MTNLAKLTKAQLIAQIEDLRHEFLTLQVESQDTIEDLRTKYNDLAAARQGASHQDRSAQRFETMQKAKALAMASGRSVKC